MTADVVAFIDGGDERPEKFSADLVDMLEELLERAKSGSISAVACAIVRSDGQAATRWVCGHEWQRLGFAIPMLQHDYFKRLDGAR